MILQTLSDIVLTHFTFLSLTQKSDMNHIRGDFFQVVGSVEREQRPQTVEVITLRVSELEALRVSESESLKALYLNLAK